MAFQPVPNTASFRLIHVYDSVNALINTIHVRDTVNPWGATKLSNTATRIGDAWRDNMLPLLANTVVFDRVDAADEGAEFGQRLSVEYNTTGSLAGNPLSPMVCQLVKLTGSPGSAPRQGRLFISPATEDVATNDVFTAAYRTSVLAAMTAVDSAISTLFVNEAWVIVSRFLNGAKRATAVTNTIAARTARNIVASQRDRRAGVGG